MPDVHVRNERGRIWLDGDVKPDRLKNIFGIVSFSEVEHIQVEELEQFLPDYCRRHGIEKAKTFAIKMKRVGTHTFSSNDKAIEYGNLLRNEFPHLKVNLANPDKEIHIEIRANEAYLYDTVIKAVGGLPLGVEGTLVALVSGGIDSPVAAWMMMKRGCRIIPLFVALDTFLDETTIARAQTCRRKTCTVPAGHRTDGCFRFLSCCSKGGTDTGGIWKSTPASSASAGCTGLPLHMQTRSGQKGS